VVEPSPQGLKVEGLSPGCIFTTFYFIHNLLSEIIFKVKNIFYSLINDLQFN
jgi:hypothetical protein